MNRFPLETVFLLLLGWGLPAFGGAGGDQGFGLPATTPPCKQGVADWLRAAQARRAG